MLFQAKNENFNSLYLLNFTMKITEKIKKYAHDKMFGMVHSSRLVYNTCWEDPRLDRRMLDIGPESRVVVITSAGDNALDYLLDSPRSVDCVDVNYRQNALLELKKALFKHADHDALFEFFGRGGSDKCLGLYADIRFKMPKFAQDFWDRNISYFQPGLVKKSFYYRGTSGIVAWSFSRFMSLVKPGLRYKMDRLLHAGSLDEQREIFESLEPEFWDRISCWIVSRPSTMALLGVPRPQITLITNDYPGGLEGFVRDKVRRVFTELPVTENYFWRVYLYGEYSPDCCPEYLKKENFQRIRTVIDRLGVHTSTVSEFLNSSDEKYNRFILLDHQDWLAWNAPEALREEWELILEKSEPGAMVLMRSAGMDVSFVPVDIRSNLRFFPEITEPLHCQDRVGTYGSQHLAEVL